MPTGPPVISAPWPVGRLLSCPGRRRSHVRVLPTISSRPIRYQNVLAPPVLARLIANFKTGLDLVIVAAPPIGDALAPSVLALADMLLVAVDSRRPTLPIRLPVRMPRLALTVFTHAR